MPGQTVEDITQVCQERHSAPWFFLLSGWLKYNLVSGWTVKPWSLAASVLVPKLGRVVWVSRCSKQCLGQEYAEKLALRGEESHGLVFITFFGIHSPAVANVKLVVWIINVYLTIDNRTWLQHITDIGAHGMWCCMGLGMHWLHEELYWSGTSNMENWLTTHPFTTGFS